MPERVLMIEDDAALARLVADYLRPLGFEVSASGTASDGLRRLGQGAYDAVLLDVMLPDLDGLIEELLEASRLTAGHGRDNQDAVDLLGLAAEEAARVGAEAEGDAVVIRGDARLLRRLLRNLLENAARHGGGSPVEVRVERGVAAAARLRVSDRGPGVAAAERERVFEPFHRPPGAAETGSGYGLGLALVRQIARAHGGDARCLGREGGGTVFEVDLAG